MNTKTAIALCFVAGLIVFSTVGQFRGGEPKTPEPGEIKIAVVNVREIFRLCKKNVQYRQQAMTEFNQASAELKKLSSEIDANEAELKVLKPGSPDYLTRYEQLLQKKANLDARQQFHKQKMSMRDQRWTEEVYQQILQVVQELAKEMQLDLVFDKQQPEFPSGSGDDLMLTLSTNKLLYVGGRCPDITSQVTARLDESK